MSKLEKEIKAGIGLGAIKFGMSRTEVKAILGKPDDSETYAYTEGDDLKTEDWFYDELDLSVSFDEEEEWKLVTLSVAGKDYALMGFQPISMSKESLKATLKEKNITDLEFEDCSTEENPSHELLESEQLGINFWFDEDQLSEVQWGPLFIDDDTIKWP